MNCLSFCFSISCRFDQKLQAQWAQQVKTLRKQIDHHHNVTLTSLRTADVACQRAEDKVAQYQRIVDSQYEYLKDHPEKIGSYKKVLKVIYVFMYTN